MATHSIPYSFAKRHGLICLQSNKDTIEVIARRNIQLSSLCELRRYFGQALQINQVSADVFATYLQNHYESDGNGAARMMEDLGEEWDLSRVAEELAEPEDLLESADDAPIIRLINALLTEAIKENASDIHIESFENRLQVRFRIDGVMREALIPPRQLGPLLVSRVKVMANLDIAEKRLPQDGRISLRVGGRPVDVRVSTLPAGHGERVVLRLLDKRSERFDLNQLGLAKVAQQQLLNLLQRPHGILLVTGPTGSGKTTTLYAALSHLNNQQRNIMTVEDPIEYFIDGISQTQVNSKVDMSFARGLRAILRQDPDAVMVGEVRDLETAEIAVQASLTGHLVLSTLHTNSAVGTITRLRDMGIESFLLATSLIGVIAQRLVRKLCAHCKQPYDATAADRRMLGIDRERFVLYRGSGCEHCNQSGHRGRVGTFEVLINDSEMQNMIHDDANEALLQQYVSQHSPELTIDCRNRVLSGETSVEEFMRVTQRNG